MPVRALKLKVEEYKPNEEALMQRIAQALRLHGYTVFITVHRYKRQSCPKCFSSFWPKGGYGATKGIGDLLVGIPRQQPSLLVMGDIKTAQGKLSPEQQLLADQGVLCIWRDEETALEDLQQRERQLRAAG